MLIQKIDQAKKKKQSAQRHGHKPRARSSADAGSSRHKMGTPLIANPEVTVWAQEVANRWGLDPKGVQNTMSNAKRLPLVEKLAPSLPIDGLFPFIHPERKFMHLGFHIYDLGFQSPDSEAAKPMVFATTLLLIGLVVLMNLTAILIRNHLRRKYAASTF